jgi:hypothetical protein
MTAKYVEKETFDNGHATQTVMPPQIRPHEKVRYPVAAGERRRVYPFIVQPLR